MHQIIVWDLDPEMANLWQVLPIKYYSICFALGLLLGFQLVSDLLQKEQVSDRNIEKLALHVFFGTLLGARIGHCLFYEFPYYWHHPLEILLPFRITPEAWEYTGFLGLASHGGVLGVLIAVVLFCYQTKINIWYILDRIAVGGALAAGFIRIGNFMNSEIIGIPTGGNFGVIFKRVDLIPRHPAQLYESVSYFLIFFLLLLVQKKKCFQERPGMLFGLFFSLLFTARFLLEFVKIRQVAFESGLFLSMGQLLSIPFILLGFGVMIFRKERSSLDEYVFK